MKKKKTKAINGREVFVSPASGIKILGLDCSSSTIGWGLISKSSKIELSAYGHIKPLSSEHFILERLEHTYSTIISLCKTYKPDYVCVEDIILFMKNKSQAQTITTLAVFNRVISLACYSQCKSFCYLPVMTIRSQISKYCNIKGIKKEDMPNIILSHLCPSYNFLYMRNGKLKKEVGDEADGIAAGWALAIKLKDDK